MINILFILLIKFSFSTDITFSVVSETYSNNQPKIIQIYSKALNPQLIRAEYYYTNGSLRRIENYKENILHDLVIEYTDRGAIQFKGEYDMGEFLGDTLKIFDDNGKIVSKHAYVNGALNGVSYGYNRNGNIIKEESYINNILNGERLTYYDSSNILSRENFKNGLLDGSNYIYHDNGAVYFIGSYIDNLLNGYFFYSNMNQEIIFEGEALDSKFNGILKYYPMNDLVLRDDVVKPWKEIKMNGEYRDSCECYIAKYKKGEFEK